LKELKSFLSYQSDASRPKTRGDKFERVHRAAFGRNVTGLRKLTRKRKAGEKRSSKGMGGSGRWDNRRTVLSSQMRKFKTFVFVEAARIIRPIQIQTFFDYQIWAKEGNLPALK